MASYAQAYPASAQNIKDEPGLQQVKLEPSTDYADNYFVGDEDSSYNNYDMLYDQSGAMYTDPGGSFSDAGLYADDAAQLTVMENRKPRPQKVLLLELYGNFLFGKISDTVIIT